MKVTEITVSAGRTFNHPYEQYANLKPHVTFRAVLEDGEDFEAATKERQAKAERLVEDHKQHMLDSLEEIERTQRTQQEVQSIEETITRAQHRLDAIRFGRKQIAAAEGAEGDPWTP